MKREEKFMERAIELAKISIEDGGGPFGAVIVKNDKIIAEASNRVTQDHDPTAHAEVVAIRKAAANLKDFSLEECEIYAMDIRKRHMEQTFPNPESRKRKPDREKSWLYYYFSLCSIFFFVNHF